MEGENGEAGSESSEDHLRERQRDRDRDKEGGEGDRD